MRRSRSSRAPDTESDLRFRGRRRERSRAWQWVRRACLALVGLAAIVVGLVVLALHSLDRPWLKERVRSLARSSAGLEIDYQSARVDVLSDAVIEGLVVQSPAAYRAFAPELVRVGHVEAHDPSLRSYQGWFEIYAPLIASQKAH